MKVALFSTDPSQNRLAFKNQMTVLLMTWMKSCQINYVSQKLNAKLKISQLNCGKWGAQHSNAGRYIQHMALFLGHIF